MNQDKDENPFTFVDAITLLISGVTIVMIIIFMAYIGPVQASEGRNWCADWKDGYLTGLCWSKLECEIPTELECPLPADGQRDGYMVGLNTGLSDGEE